MTYMEAYVGNWQVQSFPRGPLWYRRKAKEAEREIMEDAYLAGFNVKSIASYFRISVYRVYGKINVRALKKRLKEVN